MVASHYYFVPALLLFSFVKAHFFEGRKWKKCWLLEKNHSQGHDFDAKFIISMDFLQHTNETIINSEQSPFIFSFLSYTTCCWHCTMQSGQQCLKETKIPNIKTQATTTWSFIVCFLISCSSLLSFVTFKLVQKLIEIMRIVHGTIDFHHIQIFVVKVFFWWQHKSLFHYLKPCNGFFRFPIAT